MLALFFFAVSMTSPPEIHAQKFLRIDSVKTGDSVFSVQVTPYGPTYIDIFKSKAGTADSLKLYIIPYGEADSMQASSMAENQITFNKDSLLIVPSTVKFRTWKIMDANVQTVKLKMVNDSGNTNRVIKIIVRGLSDIRGSLLENNYKYAVLFKLDFKQDFNYIEHPDYPGEFWSTEAYNYQQNLLRSLKPEDFDFKLVSVYNLTL
jgi:hypothetical protein